MVQRKSQAVVRGHWDRLYAPTASLAVVTTVDADGLPNAAAFGACVKVSHDPVAVSFTVGAGRDTYYNVLATGEFVVNVPSYERDEIESLCISGRDFAPGVSELEEAGLTALPAQAVRPPRIAEYGRQFECTVISCTQWRDRLTVFGELVAASCDPAFVDAEGYLRWDVAKPVTYCGGEYGLAFAPSYETFEIEGPDLLASLRPAPPGLTWRAR